MKRICLLLGILLFMLALPTMAASHNLTREEIPVLNEKEASAAGLKALGILEGTENGLELEKGVTRAEVLTFIERTVLPQAASVPQTVCPFTDIEGHWARETITAFYHMGLVNGTSDTTYTPDRQVSGKEFAKIMLSAMGYTDVTIENAYDLAKETELAQNNFTGSVVRFDMPLLRGDAVRLCFSALTARVPSGEMLYKNRIARGENGENDFEGILYVGCGVPAALPFGATLNARISKDQNYMISPLSVKMALSLAANGAAGETQEEILAVLGEENIETLNSKMEAMLEKYEEGDVLRLSIANAVFLNTDSTSAEFAPAYLDTIAAHYHATAEKVNRKNAVEKINGWVSDKTERKITQIISEPTFTAVLLNAVYFKAAWEDAFSEDATSKETFYSRDGSTAEIDVMHKTDKMSYFETDAGKIVELPYKTENGDVSMFLVLADENQNPVALLQRAVFSQKRVQLSMPNFEMEYSVKLNEILKAMGMEKAFTDEADFRPMLGGVPLQISDVLHKTYIKVDEKETEAAATTAIVTVTSAMMPETPVEFKADRPFTFIVRDNTNDEILFIGEYAYAE